MIFLSILLLRIQIENDRVIRDPPFMLSNKF